MLVDLLSDILSDYRDNLSIEQLEYILNERCLDRPAESDSIESWYFKLAGGTVFFKSELMNSKEQFLIEFEDYIRSNALADEFRGGILTLAKLYIPELFYIEWLGIDLDSKLAVYDLLFNMVLKPKNSRDSLKSYFNELVEIYSVLVIYSQLLNKNYGEDPEYLFTFITRVEIHEESLKKQLFELFTAPAKVRRELPSRLSRFREARILIEDTIQDSFTSSLNYSKILLKRVVERELKNFELFSLFSRYNYETYYEWLLSLEDGE